MSTNEPVRSEAAYLRFSKIFLWRTDHAEIVSNFKLFLTGTRSFNIRIVFFSKLYIWMLSR